MTSLLKTICCAALLFASWHCTAASNLHAAVAANLHAAVAANLHIAVAANLAAPVQRLKAMYEQQTGDTLVISLGSTGRLFAQISNGAPFDVLLAADGTTAEKLVALGHAKAGSARTFAVGRLVLWSRLADGVDNTGAVLKSGQFQRLAIADPKLAPYGAAASAALAAMGLRDAVATKLVQGESIAQAYQFVATGNAELGLLALSQVWLNGAFTHGSGWTVPANLHPPLVHQAVALHVKNSAAATQRFVAFLMTEPVQRVLRQHGYDAP